MSSKEASPDEQFLAGYRVGHEEGYGEGFLRGFRHAKGYEEAPAYQPPQVDVEPPDFRLSHIVGYLGRNQAEK